jgi:isopenicillin N synthase-like dioxygenase
MSLVLETAAGTYRETVDQIADRGYALVPNPLTSPQLDRFFGSFTQFLALDQSVKDRFGFDLYLPGRDEPSEIGYYYTKKGQKQRPTDLKPKDDDKEIVHWNHYAINQLAETAELHPEGLPFYRVATSTYLAVEEAMGQFLTEVLEEGAPGITGQFFRYGKPPNIFMRAIAYNSVPGIKPGDFVAQPHHDKSSLTWGIGETRNGFEIARRGGERVAVPYRATAGLAMLFPGTQILKLDSETLRRRDFPASHHAVRETAGPAYSPEYSRLSLVAFLDGLEAPYIPQNNQ